MQIVSRRAAKPPSRLRRLAKPVIFAVLGVDILLGTIFLVHKGGEQPVNAAQQPAAASMFPTSSSENDGSMVSEDNNPSRTDSGVPMRVNVAADVMRDNLVRVVPPKTPSNLNESASVRLHALIGRDGSVQQVKAVSGSAELAQAAEAAVRQWKYKPYLVNGKPADVDTQIQVNFVAAGRGEAR